MDYLVDDLLQLEQGVLIYFGVAHTPTLVFGGLYQAIGMLLPL